METEKGKIKYYKQIEFNPVFQKETITGYTKKIISLFYYNDKSYSIEIYSNRTVYVNMIQITKKEYDKQLKKIKLLLKKDLI